MQTKLTPREDEILKLVAKGLSSKEIADIHGISVNTVENHRANIIKKLGLSGKNALIKYLLTKKK